MTDLSIQDFLLRDEHNLRIATVVGEAWPEARARLVEGFLDRLTKRFLSDFPEWKSKKYKRFLVDEWASLYLWKDVWNDQYSVALQSSRSMGMLLGIQRDEQIVGSRPLSEEVLTAVRDVQPSARPHRWWDALITLRSPAPDWTVPEVLWQMHSDETFLESIADQMVAVARKAEPILDRLARSVDM